MEKINLTRNQLKRLVTMANKLAMLSKDTDNYETAEFKLLANQFNESFNNAYNSFEVISCNNKKWHLKDMFWDVIYGSGEINLHQFIKICRIYKIKIN